MGSEILLSEIHYDENVDKLGTGSFGTVYRGRCRGVDVAIKVPHKQRLNLDERAQLHKEVSFMSKNSHPNIVRLMGACTEQGRLLIVTEKCSTDLENLIAKRKDISFAQWMRFARDIAKGIAWMHYGHPPIIHRDLKPANILVDANYQMKISDFGLAYARTHRNVLDKAKGSLTWMAPEVIQERPFTEKIDVYSFGIILWQIVTKKTPYEHLNTMREFVTAICDEEERPPLDEDNIPINLKVLIARCWAPNPAERYEFREIVFRLNEIITDADIKDTAAAWLWKEEYLLSGHQDLQEQVEWESFVALLSKKHSTIPKEELRRLAPLVAETPKHEGGIPVVSMARFYQFVQWFGPFYDPIKGYPIIKEMIALLDTQWFHGCINRDLANSRISGCNEPGCFLVRLSTTDPLQFPFTITVANNTHCRVERVANGVQGLDGKVYKNITEYVGLNAQQFKYPCPKEDAGKYDKPAKTLHSSTSPTTEPRVSLQAFAVCSFGPSTPNTSHRELPQWNELRAASTPGPFALSASFESTL